MNTMIKQFQLTFPSQKAYLLFDFTWRELNPSFLSLYSISKLRFINQSMPSMTTSNILSDHKQKNRTLGQHHPPYADILWRQPHSLPVVICSIIIYLEMWQQSQAHSCSVIQFGLEGLGLLWGEKGKEGSITCFDHKNKRHFLKYSVLP